jgi:hypothetical protein
MRIAVVRVLRLLSDPQNRHFWSEVDREIFLAIPRGTEGGSDKVGAPVFQDHGASEIALPALLLFRVAPESRVVGSGLVAPAHGFSSKKSVQNNDRPREMDKIRHSLPRWAHLGKI